MATDTATPFWDEAESITCHASAAVTGKRFVAISGARVDGNPRVASAAGTATTKPGLIMPVTASGAITAGQPVYSAADGRATATVTGLVAGWAMDDAADGVDCPIKLA